ncbi:4'-phosphopantetheinyl transferase superfamily protein [Pseudomonas juntendi]|uniref:Enterobactin synthase component D n=1 Tax=Pseudomonas juntendi TaxID=2666183 RepID=A0ABD4YD73_9PSED|nr:MULTISPECIES: 4'-phosphopantetheinyl transferase superfamily protein [Pseudomonas]MDH0757169.1 4'-phosphopantetheinyl transferase superfamily protein [Pseudomonas juntendi]MDH1918180.1 4'-phosphopantetheinyl transferase superfamily protein [Pseudomonas juntendi]RRV78270.1 4'-phosphopantetheinyl transferase superfamily protein [Pseudomonas sp. p99-361]
MREAQPVWPFRGPPPAGLALFALDLEGYCTPCDAVLHDARWLGPALAPRRREFAGGRVCAAAALGALGHEQGWLPIARPYRYARFPLGTVGSISHTRKLALACVADAGLCLGLGIDIEDMVGSPELSEMAEHAMHPEERERFQRMRGDEALRFFYLCFSAKEAFYKAVFPLCHVELEMDEAQLTDWDDQGRFELALRSQRLGERFSDGHVFHGSWAVQGETLYVLLTIDHAASTRPRAG